MNNKEKIKKLVIGMLNDSFERAVEKVDKVLNSGCVDVDSWDDKNEPMIIPRCILVAILEDESTEYTARGTSFEKRVKKEVKNIRYFL